VNDQDLPPAFRAADRYAVDRQQKYLRLVRIELVAIVAAAFVAELSWDTESYNIAGLVAAGALAVAAVARLVDRKLGREHRWLTARSAAERIKSQAWQFAAGGDDYPIEMDATAATNRFTDLVANVGGQPPATRAIPATSVTAEPPQGQVTDWMERTRQAPLTRRRRDYLDHRLADQRQWYAKKADVSGRRAQQWSAVVLGGEAAAVVLALAGGFRLIDVGWAGVTGSVAAAGLAWLQARRHGFLRDAYGATRIAADALARRAEQNTFTEDAWRAFVGEVETLFGREHQAWLTQHQTDPTSHQPDLASANPPLDDQP
jgi:hypothetical protein